MSHNKFIVLLKGGVSQAVLTGSTNFSRGGVFGQSNVVHIAEDHTVADAYLKYWELLQANTEHEALKTELSSAHPLPAAEPALGTLPIFSPREELDALNLYGRLAMGANEALFMTFAFGINKVFKDVYKNGTAGLRYALLDKLLGPGVRKEKKAEAEAEMLELRKQKENRFAVGSRLATNKFDRWVKESLTGFNTHVQFIHTKFMLVDPLSDDPIVVTGSANFSDASSTNNDENMLLIRGDTRVADIYLGEYMRLWNHYAFREWAAKQDHSDETKFKFLDTENKWWRFYFGDTAKSRQRLYFSKPFGVAPIA